MSPGTIKVDVVVDKVAWVRRMLDSLADLPLENLEAFLGDSRNPAAAESYLRRALESLLDLGRHILAKGFGLGIVEYKEIASQLASLAVLSKKSGAAFFEMAGYRNRMTHFYDEVRPQELYLICTSRTGDLETILDEILAWLRSNPEKLDRAL